MSRVNNNVKSNPVQQQPKPQQTRQAGEKNSFSKRMNKQASEKSVQQQPKTSSKGKKEGQLKQSKSSLLHHKKTAVFGRRGNGSTVADLQAKFEQNQKNVDSTQSTQQNDTTQIQTDAKSGGKVNPQIKDGLQNDDLSVSLDLNSGQGIGQPGAQMIQGQTGPMDLGSIQVQGTRVPTQMLDKIVDQARVGVNAAGAAEFQFDLKGDVLGGLKMRMSMDGGQLSAIFVAENPEVRKFIDGNLQDLKKALEDRGIHIKDLEIRDPEEDQRERKRQQNQKDREDAWG